MARLCLELASLEALPAAEEAALLGVGPTRREVEEEAQRLCVELASLGALPAGEEAALLGLPPPLRTADLPRPLVILKCRAEGAPAGREATFFILGTAHVSEQSCRDAAALVRAVRPQFVFLELCKERAAMLGSEVRIRAPTLGEAAQLLRAGKATPFSILYSWALARVGKAMELDPGAEFRAALLEGRAVGARYVLGDRPISVTMARMWAALSGWEKARLLASLLWTGARSRADKQELRQEIERLKGGDALMQAVGKFAQDFPGIIGPLVTERDLYMIYVLRRLAAFGDRVVAVVGAGHLAGIREHWNDEISLEELMRIPERK